MRAVLPSMLKGRAGNHRQHFVDRRNGRQSMGFPSLAYVASKFAVQGDGKATAMNMVIVISGQFCASGFIMT